MMKKRTILLVVCVIAVAGLTAGLSGTTRRAVKERTKWAVVTSNVYQDGLRRIGVRQGQIDDPYIGERAPAAIEAFRRDIRATYGNYLPHLDERHARGHVLEIGPGSTIGVALLFVGDGAPHATLIDKFVPLQRSDFHRQVYLSLRNELPPPVQQRYDETIDLSDGVRLNPARITYLHMGIEDADAAIPPASIDVVVSNAVLQEVFDADRMFLAIDRVLAPGGVQIHKIDLSDYGMFSKYGHHPLEFLTIPDAIYRFMVEASGQPNRRRVDYYRQKMAQLGYQAEVSATRLLGDDGELIPPVRLPMPDTPQWRHALEQARSIKPRLLERYRRLADEDLAVQGIVLVARKPPSDAPPPSATRNLPR